MHCYSLCVLFICYCIPGVHLYKKILQIFTRIPDLTQRNMPLLEPQCYWQTDWLFKEEDWVLWREVFPCLCMFKITNTLWRCQTLHVQLFSGFAGGSYVVVDHWMKYLKYFKRFFWGNRSTSSFCRSLTWSDYIFCYSCPFVSPSITWYFYM